MLFVLPFCLSDLLTRYLTRFRDALAYVSCGGQGIPDILSLPGTLSTAKYHGPCKIQRLHAGTESTKAAQERHGLQKRPLVFLFSL